MHSLRSTREAGKNHLHRLGGTREAPGRLVARLPIESGAGFCIILNTISMAIGPVRGKSWGGLHGWLPVAQASTGLPLTGRHQRGRKGLCGQPEKHQGGRKGLIGQLARHQGGRKGSIGQPARHQGGTRKVGKNHLDSLGGTRRQGKDQVHSLRSTREAGKNHLHRLGGTREAPGRLVARLPIESGAGFCIILNTISMAIGPVRGKSWGGLHGWLPVAQASTGLPLTGRHQRGRKGLCGQPEKHQGGRKGLIGQLARHQGGRKGSIGQPARHQGGTREVGKNHLDSLGGTREAGKDQLDSLRGTKEAPGRQERAICAQDCRSNPGFGRAPDFV